MKFLSRFTIYWYLSFSNHLSRWQGNLTPALSTSKNSTRLPPVDETSISLNINVSKIFYPISSKRFRKISELKSSCKSNNSKTSFFKSLFLPKLENILTLLVSYTILSFEYFWSFLTDFCKTVLITWTKIIKFCGYKINFYTTTLIIVEW